jgi:hypothetical protein
VDDPLNNLFRKIAHDIPLTFVSCCKVYVYYTVSVVNSFELQSREHVGMDFEFMCAKLDLSKDKGFLLKEIKCWQGEIDNANNQGWEKACAWADFWGHCYTEMTDAD